MASSGSKELGVHESERSTPGEAGQTEDWLGFQRITDGFAEALCQARLGGGRTCNVMDYQEHLELFRQQPQDQANLDI